MSLYQGGYTMTVTQVIEHFGSVSEVSRKLRVTYQAVQHWKNHDEVPEGRQWQIQALTKGKLKASVKSAA